MAIAVNCLSMMAYAHDMGQAHATAKALFRGGPRDISLAHIMGMCNVTGNVNRQYIYICIYIYIYIYIFTCISTDRLLPIDYCVLTIAWYLLPIAYCPLPIDQCLLLIACCLLPIA